MARVLTEQQQKFLDVLFYEGIDGDIRKAMELAGYSNNLPTSKVTVPLKDEILEKTKEYLAVQGPKAAAGIIEIITDPTQLGNRDKLAASKEVLDRIGVIKSEGIVVEAQNGVMILPPKDDADNPAEAD